jgi:membrane protease YdiL (CAAX protease family)/NAD-dependent dihydropyrimidine dehydrogenase PreA subunit
VRPTLSLAPERCDRCMWCVDACPLRAIRVGGTYVFIDWTVCDGCGRCVSVCERGVIFPRGEQPAAAPVEQAPAAAPAKRPGRLWPRTKRAASSDVDAPPARGIALRDVAPFSTRWDVWEVAAVLGGLLLLLTLQQLVVRSAFMTHVVPLGAKPLMRAGILTLYYAAQLALFAALGLRKGVGVREAFGLKRVQVLPAAIGVTLLLVATRVFALVYGVVAESLGWQMPTGPTTNITQYFGRDTLGLVLTVVMVVIIGPFFEEAVFRGVFLNAVQDRYGGVVAIWASAVLFAAFHLSAWLFLPLVVMGLAAGWLAVRRGSLWPAYALHLTYNAVAVFAAFVLAK